MEEETKRLFARADALLSRASEGVFAATEFLTPAEAYRLRSYLRGRGEGDRVLFYGGAPGAERTVLCALPDYYLPYTDLDPSEREPYILQCAAEALEETVRPLRITGSTYRDLTHRDYLGSALALGIRRSVIGDIVCTDSHTAVMFVLSHMTDFLCENLVRIGSDKVRTEICTLPEGFTVERRYETVTDSVASPRLDCVVGGLLNLSREHAQSAVLSGAVELNYEPAVKTDLTVHSGDLLSVRGYGKFVIDSVEERNRRGRIRLLARRYV